MIPLVLPSGYCSYCHNDQDSPQLGYFGRCDYCRSAPIAPLENLVTIHMDEDSEKDVLIDSLEYDVTNLKQQIADLEAKGSKA